MPSLFKKLFGRKSKSDPLNGNSESSSTILTAKQTKKEKSKAKKLSKRKKQQDKLAHFPSKEQPLATSINSSSHNGEKNPFLLHLENGEVEKENSPVGMMSLVNQHAQLSNGHSFNGQRTSDGNHSPQLYKKPTLSLIAEEDNTSGSTSALNQPSLGSNDHNNSNQVKSSNQPNNLLSPTMSGNKPPLTPIRHNVRNNNAVAIAGSKPLTPSSYRSPNPNNHHGGAPQAGRMNTHRLAELDTSLYSPIFL